MGLGNGTAAPVTAVQLPPFRGAETSSASASQLRLFSASEVQKRKGKQQCHAKGSAACLINKGIRQTILNRNISSLRKVADNLIHPDTIFNAPDILPYD